jgi:hypothetical protein
VVAQIRKLYKKIREILGEEFQGKAVLEMPGSVTSKKRYIDFGQGDVRVGQTYV